MLKTETRHSSPRKVWRNAKIACSTCIIVDLIMRWNKDCEKTWWRYYLFTYYFIRFVENLYGMNLSAKCIKRLRGSMLPLKHLQWLRLMRRRKQTVLSCEYERILSLFRQKVKTQVLQMLTRLVGRAPVCDEAFWTHRVCKVHFFLYFSFSMTEWVDDNDSWIEWKWEES